MSTPLADLTSRRAFLKCLAATPFLAAAPFPFADLRQRSIPQSGGGEALIASARDAINVFDFEALARQKLPPAHWGYLATGVDDDATIKANREGFTRYEIRARRLVDVSKVDMSIRLFGATWATPIILAPVGSQRGFHPDGEVAVGRACRSKGHLFVLSTVGTASVEEVTAAAGGPIWFQLYPTNDWNVSRAMVKRAEAAGCPVLVLTVDLQGGSNRETLRRFERRDTRACTPCHPRGGGFAANNRRKPMFDGLDLSGVRSVTLSNMAWDYIQRLKDVTTMKVVVKGIVTREDAALAVARGADGVIVSNHGGRAEESGRSAIECLPEVVDAVAGRVPVLVDSGFRRGTDIFKALALGATAVCIGRPYCWGLASFGQEGVEAVLDILRRELQTVMRQAGTIAIAQIGRSHVIAPAR